MRRLLYRRPVNRALRTALRPLAGRLPDRARFGVVDPFLVEMPSGETFRMVGNETSYVAKQLFWLGPAGYEPHVLPLVSGLLRAVDGFVDGGANIGYYSLMARALNSSIRVHAFEPLPAALHYLRRNLALNPDLASGVRVEPVALSGSEGQMSFTEAVNPKFAYLEHQLTGANGFDVPESTGYARRPPITVDVTTLDAWWTSPFGGGAWLLKLDIEGAELDVVRGGRDVLSSTPVVLLFESYPGEYESDLEAALADYGFALFHARPDGLHPVDRLAPHNAHLRDFVAAKPSEAHLIAPFLAPTARPHA
jgi:FkbM family methyltransferase